MIHHREREKKLYQAPTYPHPLDSLSNGFRQAPPPGRTDAPTPPLKKSHAYVFKKVGSPLNKKYQ